MQIIFSRKSKTTFWNNEILTDIIAVVGLGIEVVIGLVGIEVEGLILVLVAPGRVSTVILAEREKIIKNFLMRGVYLPCPTRYYVHRPLPSSKIPYFQNELGQVHNLSCKNEFYLYENEIIFISKAEFLTSFWYRGPRELRNGLFIKETL